GLIDALNAELEEVWRNGHPQAWVNLVEGGVGYSRPLKPDDALKPDNLVKLLDIYEFLESARRVIFAPRIQRFLEIIFERPLLPHQGLGSSRGPSRRSIAIPPSSRSARRWSWWRRGSPWRTSTPARASSNTTRAATPGRSSSSRASTSGGPSATSRTRSSI